MIRPDDIDPDEFLVLSASSLVGVKKSKALETWTLNTIGTRVVEDIDSLSYLAKVNPDLAAKHVAELHWTNSSGLSASARGTLLHAALEAWIRGEEQPAELAQHEELWPFLERLYEWLAKWRPTLVAAERVCYHSVHLIGGQFDLIADIEVGGVIVRYLLDLKTAADKTARGNLTKPHGDSVGIQLATYRGADRILPEGMAGRHYSRYGDRMYRIGPEEVAASEPMIAVDASGVLHLTPERCALYAVDYSPEIYQRARDAGGLWLWDRIESRSTISRKPTLS